MPVEDISPAHAARLRDMGAEQDRRNKTGKVLDAYYDGKHPLAEALAREAQKADGAYILLKALAAENWPGLSVDTVNERVENQGVLFGDRDTDRRAREIYQRNYGDAEFNLANLTSFIHGRSFAIVWDETGDGLADITIEGPDTTIVEYVPGSRFKRAAAMRRWSEDGVWYATLFLPDGLYKYRQYHNVAGALNPPDRWRRHEVDGEEWPIPNPLGVVPVVERAVNRRMRAGKYGSAVGEFEPHLAIIDRINYTVFAGLAGMTWAGFQALALIGDPITRDPVTKKPLQPFTYEPGKVIQIANPNAKIQQLTAADLKGYLDHANDYIGRFAALTRTPAYKMNAGQIVNVGSEGMRLLDDGFIAKITGHHVWLGEADAEIMRLAFLVEGDDQAGRNPLAKVVWKDPEMSTLAAQADAAGKMLGAGLPWQLVGKKVFKLSAEEIAETQAEIDSGTLGTLMAQAEVQQAPSVA